LNQRDDLLLQPGDRKISGTAARIAHGRAYHHLTLLIKPDLSVLRRVLQSPLVGKIETTATRSVRAKAVGQLIDVVPGLEIPQVIDVLVNGFQESANQAEIVHIDATKINNEAKWNGVEAKRLELQSPEWIFGKSPKFRVQLPDSTGQIKEVVVEAGHVTESENDLYETRSFFDRIKQL
jgi:lipoate-protein ligase A